MVLVPWTEESPVPVPETDMRLSRLGMYARDGWAVAFPAWRWETGLDDTFLGREDTGTQVTLAAWIQQGPACCSAVRALWQIIPVGKNSILLPPWLSMGGP